MFMDKDLASVQQARDLVEAAHQAGQTLARFDQAQIDRICEAMANAGLREAERLGRLAVEETGLGVAADKATKNRFAAGDVWNFFRTLKTVGVVADNGSVVEIASPRGVVAAIIPTTNPTSTALFKCIIAIKSRNPVVLSPHPSATRCINESVRVVREAAIKEGLPPDAIACLNPPTMDATDALMKHKRTAVILATGGLGLVRAAYSSGKPAFGVGPGNVPTFIERTAEVAKAVQDILTGTCFDNGTICASEQSVVVDAPIAQAVREQFKLQGGHFLTPAEADQVARILVTPQRTLNPGIVGRSALQIAQMAGVSVPPDTRCLLADCAGVGREYPWSIEKLSPTLAFFVVDGLEAGAARCYEILKFGGMGHTAGMHTRSREAAIAYGAQMPAARVIINSPTTHGAIGFSTALAPSMTLGCGSWGGNVTSDNISPVHLLDIKRVAFETKPVAATRPVTPLSSVANTPAPANVPAKSNTLAKPTITRTEIAAIVDKFLSQKLAQEPVTPAPQAAPVVSTAPPTNGGPTATIKQIAPLPASKDSGNGNAAPPKPKPVEFVCEDDVRRALVKNEKIYINARTIITPAARDMGDAAEVFAKS